MVAYCTEEKYKALLQLMKFFIFEGGVTVVR